MICIEWQFMILDTNGVSLFCKNIILHVPNIYCDNGGDQNGRNELAEFGAVFWTMTAVDLAIVWTFCLFKVFNVHKLKFYIA